MTDFPAHLTGITVSGSAILSFCCSVLHTLFLKVYRRFLVIHKNVQVKIIPFTIEVEEIAHHIPSRPIIPPRMIDSGILALVKAILMILQSRVLPSPDNAPTVVSSTHIKASLKPMMIRYSTDVAIAWVHEKRFWQSVPEYI